MKKTLLFSILLFISIHSVKAQYLPMFADSNRYWQEHLWSNHSGFPNGGCANTYQTIIKQNYELTVKSKKYKQVIATITSWENKPCSPELIKVLPYVREDIQQKKIYGLSLDSTEYLLYNFDKKANDTLQIRPIQFWDGTIGPITTLTITAVDSMLLNDGIYHRVFHFSNGVHNIIEGVGSMHGLLYPDYGSYLFEEGTELKCMGSLKLNKSIYGSCDTMLNTKSTDLPISLDLYPNPTHNQLIIKLEHIPLPGSYVEVLNMLGQRKLILDDQLQNMNYLDVSILERGFYILKVVTVNGTTASSFVKE